MVGCVLMMLIIAHGEKRVPEKRDRKEGGSSGPTNTQKGWDSVRVTLSQWSLNTILWQTACEAG